MFRTLRLRAKAIFSRHEQKAVSKGSNCVDISPGETFDERLKELIYFSLPKFEDDPVSTPESERVGLSEWLSDSDRH